jgi:hypothetical protein
MQKLAERTTINELQQELTPTNVAGVSHMTWPNPYKSPAKVTSASKYDPLNKDLGSQLQTDLRSQSQTALQ